MSMEKKWRCNRLKRLLHQHVTCLKPVFLRDLMHANLQGGDLLPYLRGKERTLCRHFSTKGGVSVARNETKRVMTSRKADRKNSGFCSCTSSWNASLSLSLTGKMSVKHQCYCRPLLTLKCIRNRSSIGSSAFFKAKPGI